MRIKNASPYDGLAEAVSMDLDVLDGSTSPFITLDACDGTLFELWCPLSRHVHRGGMNFGRKQ